MIDFNIISTDPLPYKQQIIQMWQNFLPGTPYRRFEWLNSGNLAGPAQWFFAIKKGSGEIIATASLLPKEFYWKGKSVKGGIIGDIMVQSKYRGQGIGRTILKEISVLLSLGDIEFLYVVPNRRATKVVEDAGFLKSIPLKVYVKPIDLTYYIRKYLKIPLVKYLASFLSYPYQFALRANTKSNSFFQVLDATDPSLDRLWEKVGCNSAEPLSDQSTCYIQWRYFQNPDQNFKIVTHRNKEKSLTGYATINISGNQIRIYNILTLDKKNIGPMINKMTQIAITRNCHAIYFAVPSKSKLLSRLRRHGFIYARSSMKVHYLTSSRFPFEKISFFEGDRNV